MEDEDAVGVAGLSGAGWEITAVRFLIGRTRRARALGGTVSFLCCKKGCGLVCLAGQDGSPERSHIHMAEIILVFLLAKLISLH